MVATHLSIGMLLLFQLNGGAYMLSYMNHDFSGAMKWRLKSVPCPNHILIFSCIGTCTLFTTAQGLLVVLITSIFMNAYWGNYAITLIVILLSSFFSQLLNIIIYLFVKNLGLAETLAWFSTWVMAALGGLIFTLPNNTFFNFMAKYGTPFSLGQTAIKSSGFLNPSSYEMWISLTSLLIINLIFAVIVVMLGRRKLT